MNSWDGYPRIPRPDLKPVVRTSRDVPTGSYTLSWRAEGTFLPLLVQT